MRRKPDPIHVVFESSLNQLQAGESLDSVLESLPQGAQALRPALEMAAWLGERRQVFSPRPGFVAASPRRLASSIQRQGVGVQPSANYHRAQPRLGGLAKLGAATRLTCVLLLLVTACFSFSRMLSASSTWLPGDLAYPLKIFVERIQLALASNPAQEARLRTHFAQRRLLEAQALFFEARYDQVPWVVSDFSNQVGGAVQAIGQISGYNIPQARLLALDLQEVLSRQTMLVGLLASLAPETTRGEFNRLVLISQDGVSAIQGLLSPSSSQPGKTVGQAPWRFGATLLE